jgi:hypothetical protein
MTATLIAVGLDHRLPAVLLFQCIDCGHVDMVEWPESQGEEAP